MMPYNPPPPPRLSSSSGNHHHHHHSSNSQMVVGVPINPYQRVQQIVQEISRTVPQSQRRRVLESTLQFLSHNDTAIHDYEIDLGADRALCLQLGYLDMMLNSSSPTNANATNDNNNNNNNNNSHHYQQQDSTPTMISATATTNAASLETNQHTKDQTMICWCFTRIYQCSREYKLKSYHDIGRTDLVPIMAKILKRNRGGCISSSSSSSSNNNNRRQNSDHSAPEDSILLPVLQTLRIFAKLDTQVKSSLLRWKNGRLISLLVDLLRPPVSTDGVTNLPKIPAAVAPVGAVAMESWGILKDISFRLSNDDKEYLYSFVEDPLVQWTTEYAAICNHDRSEAGKVLEAIAAIYWNIATVSKLSLVMAKQNDVLRSLDRLLLYKGAGDCIEQQVVVRVKRNALSALGNIVAALADVRGKSGTSSSSLEKKRDSTESMKERAVFLNQTWIRTRLLQLLGEESDKDCQRRVMRSIRCLASCSWGRSYLWNNGTDLESFLARAFEKKQEFDVPSLTQIYETVGCLTQDKDKMDRVGPMLMKTLIQAITNFKDQEQLEGKGGLIAAVCKALFLCLERNPNTPCPFPFYEAFFAGILACSKIEPEQTHPPIARLLLIIAIQDHAKTNGSSGLQNDRKNLSVIQNAILSKPVLDTITELLRTVGPSFDQAQNDALDLIQMFLQDTSNRKVLADNEGLLTALVGFALIAGQEDKKKSAKQMILDIVPEL